mmetsp:Transcript_26043/g.42567  ORF Transcript_26043/g.42567 Transcript_26043/m.42567 type:complete len:208 (-) Transcript_26043:165-788(-)|eukprot:CAMPEP_0202713264 /NCGR_PEP_ID=MMETSP1385-20130828/52464_1 /ASSEMBLY_ACC=CAM_ASM_000861 /TAXON_ID=933848 /ORGANISM="Elphidium margaritaceum" /LENGTH=207 /DNA_ID=CAMNT_0049373559 /DNA_START=125 /DNA_END=748 /DNA_ORIENTATION=+
MFNPPIPPQPNTTNVDKLPLGYPRRWRVISRWDKQTCPVPIKQYVEFLEADNKDKDTECIQLRALVNSQRVIISTLNQEVKSEHKRLERFLDESGAQKRVEVEVSVTDPVTHDIIKNAVVLLSADGTSCGHVLDLDSASRVLASANKSCPVCRAQASTCLRLKCIDQFIQALIRAKKPEDMNTTQFYELFGKVKAYLSNLNVFALAK